jgi:hypothetical protein
MSVRTRLIESPGEVDVEELERFGRILDHRPASLQGRTVAMALAEELLRVRAKSGRTVALKANRVQQLFEERRGRSNIVLKARQMGLTTWVAARFFLKTMTQPGTLTLEVAHSQEAAEEIFRIVHRFLDRMPEELRAGPLRTSRANARQIVFPEIDAQYRVVTAGDRNAGRGLTVQNLHCSELARWQGDAAETLAGLRAAMTPEAELVMESTPQGVGGCFYEEWQRAADAFEFPHMKAGRRGEAGLIRHFFPWWLEKGYRAQAVDVASLTEEERGLCERAGLTLEQVGFRRKLHVDFRGVVKQEYAEDAESCFLVSGEPVFEMGVVEARMHDAPAACAVRRNGALEIWLPPVAGRRYLVAVDPAGGGSEGDYSAGQVLEMETGLQCAELREHVGGLELAEVVTALAREYNEAWLVVERNNHGSGLLAYVESVCRYGRIYIDGGQAGWLTTSVSRPLMLGRLGAALVERAENFHSRRLLAECRSFVRNAEGRAEARAGCHDDLVLAMAIALGAREKLLAASY